MFRQVRLLVVLAGVLGAGVVFSSLGRGDAIFAAGNAREAVEPALLKKIASRVDSRKGIITIEASQPVAYAASQPDPQTYLIELRDVETFGFTDGFKVDPRNPVGAIQ